MPQPARQRFQPTHVEPWLRYPADAGHLVSYPADVRPQMHLPLQNADDCSFDDDDPQLRELYIECGEDALVAYHNEKGFQPKDVYAMCQVGESSKVAGSGKIGRKGIGFKSVFQISDRPVVCEASASRTY